MAKDDSGGGGSVIGLMRTLALILRDKTEYDIKHIEAQLRDTWLSNVTGIIIPTKRTKVESIAYWGSYIHEFVDPTRLIKILRDLERWGKHPDRHPVFLKFMLGELLVQKARFSMMNINSINHVAAAIYKYKERNNKKHRIMGKMYTSDVAMAEMAGKEF